MFDLRSTSGCWFLSIAISGIIGTFPANCVLAQITPDSTLPNNSNVIQQGNTFNITGGTQAGSNLFHSFKEFSVPHEGAAFFNNGVEIQNIISRVTGGAVSNIDGLIRANGTANLFLINPRGIIFGQGASLNIGGSFFATTAHSLNFADGTKFSATSAPTTPLLTISVPIGLQFNGNSGNIVNRSQSKDNRDQTVGLQVLSGHTLTFLGGDITLDNGYLQALNGRIELAAVAGLGTVGLDVNGNNISLNVPQDLGKADIKLINQAKVDVTDKGQGSIVINARNLDVFGESSISAGIKSGLQAVHSMSRNVTIDVTGTVKVNQNSQVRNVVEANATGNAGNININAGKVEVTGGQIRTRTLGNGNAGNINIKAGEILIDNPLYVSNARNRRSDDKPAIDASNFSNNFTIGRGRSGNVSLEANGSIVLIGRGEGAEWVKQSLQIGLFLTLLVNCPLLQLV